ncbi:MAG: DUF1622 domain-containing protein [Actinobacteria bacterium]|nr:DUF1622 domain-containing protein [Actinomycetota bacterium]
METLGILVLLVGTVIAGVRWGWRMWHRAPDAYVKVRAELGKAILLGLELLVAGDIIKTLLVDPTLEAVGALGLLVLVRTVLSWALSIEIDGYLPWKKWQYTHGDQQPESPSAQARPN